MQIDLEAKITPHFKYKEFLYLPKWRIYHVPLQEHVENLAELCLVLEQIRAIFKTPLKITSGIRPRVYNTEIGGSFNSLHMQGLAADFVPTKVNLHTMKRNLVDFLDELDCRMEDNGNGRWIHIDLGTPGKTGRFFKP